MIDESGQASEAELWIPLGRLATEDTSVILCGDPKQLGPVITLDVGKSLQSQFTSPLVRYMEMEDYKMDSRLCVQLVDCFRCPPWLTAVVSIIFYDRKLKPMLEEHERWPRPVFEKHRMEHWDLSHLEMEKV
jgi:helicase MOV-10